MHRYIINRRYLIFVLVALTFLLYYFDLQLIISHNVKQTYKSRYNFESGKTYIENLCSLYNDKENPIILGSICKELCKTRNNYAAFMTYQLSGRYDPMPQLGGGDRHEDGQKPLYTDFKTVLIFEDRKRNETKKVVLKAGKKFFLDVDTHMDFEFAEKPISEQLDFLAEYIESSLKRKFDYDVDVKSYREWLRLFKKSPKLAFEIVEKYADKEDLNYYVRLFYLDEYKTYMRAIEMADKKLLARVITNFVVLTGQDEYLFYKLFQSKPGTLKINGTCGHFYMTEYVEDLSTRVAGMSVQERKSLASKFLELIHSLDTTYIVKQIGADRSTSSPSALRLKSTPLQFCDVKLDNFGLNEQGELKIIDTDTIFPDSYIFRSRKCSSHDNCHFFDCKSYCDPETQRCLTSRVNNNLQTFCEKIFNNTIDPKSGILSGATSFGTNIHSEIMSRLKKCQSPGFFKNSHIPIAASDSLMRSLDILLKHDNL